uniref:Uncharacterized protein n=1 Tax=Arundo donax TaxID=35708 RepID=A0A0A9ARU6_ARUDO
MLSILFLWHCIYRE